MNLLLHVILIPSSAYCIYMGTTMNLTFVLIGIALCIVGLSDIINTHTPSLESSTEEKTIAGKEGKAGGASK